MQNNFRLPYIFLYIAVFIGFFYSVGITFATPLDSVKSIVKPPKTTTLSNGSHVTVTTGDSIVVQNPDKTSAESFSRKTNSTDGSVQYISDNNPNNIVTCNTGVCSNSNNDNIASTFTEAMKNGALDGSSNNSGPQVVIVSEKVPGADCKCMGKAGPDGKTCDVSTPIAQKKYKCTIEKGLAGFQNMFATIIRWFINIVMLCGVLAIVGLGIAWSLAGGDDAKAKSELKKWGINILVGMIILFFFTYILQFLAPWIYQ